MELKPARAKQLLAEAEGRALRPQFSEQQRRQAATNLFPQPDLPMPHYQMSPMEALYQKLEPGQTSQLPGILPVRLLVYSLPRLPH
jgi:hypothetical protein